MTKTENCFVNYKIIYKKCKLKNKGTTCFTPLIPSFDSYK